METILTLENLTKHFGPIKAVQDLSFTIEKGNVYGILGPNGSGKSTLVQLLARLYDIQQGHLQIDGIDITAFSKADLRKHIAFVTQEAMLFNAPVIENIALGASNAKIETVKNAATDAHASSFIHTLEQGYETELGDDGNLKYSLSEFF